MLLAAGQPPWRAVGRHVLWAAGSLLVALAAALSLLSPWFSEKRLEASLTDYQRGRLGPSIAAVREAHSYDPLALDPLLVWAGIEGSAGNIPEAKRLYRKAVRLKPRDAEAWFEFGVFELKVDCYAARAYEYMNRSYTLDPFGPTSRPGGPLDEARRLVNKQAGKTGKAPCS